MLYEGARPSRPPYVEELCRLVKGVLPKRQNRKDMELPERTPGRDFDLPAPSTAQADLRLAQPRQLLEAVPVGQPVLGGFFEELVGLALLIEVARKAPL